jgi:hypothetical protein
LFISSNVIFTSSCKAPGGILTLATTAPNVSHFTSPPSEPIFTFGIPIFSGSGTVGVGWGVGITISSASAGGYVLAHILYSGHLNFTLMQRKTKIIWRLISYLIKANADKDKR